MHQDCQILRSNYSGYRESWDESPAPSAPTIEPAAPGSSRADSGPPREPAAALRTGHADRGDDPVFPEDGNGNGHGTGNHLADGARHAARDDVGEVGPEPVGVGRRRHGRAVGCHHLVEDVGRGEGQERLAERAAGEGQAGGRCDRHPEGLGGRDLVEADRGQPEAADDDRGLAGLLGEQAEDGVGGPDQVLGGDVRAVADDQPRPEPVARRRCRSTNPKSAQGPEIAVDRRDGRLQQSARARRPGSRRGPRSSAGPAGPGRTRCPRAPPRAGGHERSTSPSPDAPCRWRTRHASPLRTVAASGATSGHVVAHRQEGHVAADGGDRARRSRRRAGGPRSSTACAPTASSIAAIVPPSATCSARRRAASGAHRRAVLDPLGMRRRDELERHGLRRGGALPPPDSGRRGSGTSSPPAAVPPLGDEAGRQPGPRRVEALHDPLGRGRRGRTRGRPGGSRARRPAAGSRSWRRTRAGPRAATTIGLPWFAFSSIARTRLDVGQDVAGTRPGPGAGSGSSADPGGCGRRPARGSRCRRGARRAGRGSSGGPGYGRTSPIAGWIIVGLAANPSRLTAPATSIASRSVGRVGDRERRPAGREGVVVEERRALAGLELDVAEERDGQLGEWREIGRADRPDRVDARQRRRR